MTFVTGGGRKVGGSIGLSCAIMDFTNQLPLER